MPLRAKYVSNEEGQPPKVFIFHRSCSASSSLLVVTDPIIKSPCPPIYFVHELIQKSAPSSKGD